MDYTLDTIGQAVSLLRLRGEDAESLHHAAQQVKHRYVGDEVYLRGLVEYSNLCRKNCHYCGIRSGNTSQERYTLSREEVLQAADYAYKSGFGSLVLQSGERQDEAFVSDIESLLQEIMQRTGGELGITLSLGEQTPRTYARWKKAGALRYLLRIETSSPELYARIHPADHVFQTRLDCLRALRDTGYQVGSGVMIGLPFQDEEQLARDLFFLKEMDVDMVGMGPYIPHEQTPLWRERARLLPPAELYALCLNAWAVLRLLMPDINIAATTALGTLHPQGREAALRIAANVIMPNITPFSARSRYVLYPHKICIEKSADDLLPHLEALIHAAGCRLAYHKQGNSRHFRTPAQYSE